MRYSFQLINENVVYEKDSNNEIQNFDGLYLKISKTSDFITVKYSNDLNGPYTQLAEYNNLFGNTIDKLDIYTFNLGADTPEIKFSDFEIRQ